MTMSALTRIQALIEERQSPEAGALKLEELQAWSDHVLVRVHVAVMVEPYLAKIQRGDKYIESRLTKVNIVPFDRARSGDVILFKRSGGAVVAIAEVATVAFQQLSRPGALNQLVAQHQEGLSYESGYAATKCEARYASLLWLRDVKPIAPLLIQKRGRQAWLTFEPTARTRADAALF